MFTDFLAALPIAIIALAFFAGGLVKGVIGIGLPLVAVPIMATVLAPTTAITLPAVPILCSNIWLIWEGGKTRLILALRRFWPLFLTLIPATWLAGRWLASVDAEQASQLLGGMLLLFCVLQLSPLPLRVAPRHEPWLGPVVGILGGLSGGVSSFFGPVLVTYLLLLRLDRDTFITSIALCYLVAGSALYLTLASYELLSLPHLIVSTAALLPLWLGMLLGRRLRRRIAAERFRQLLIGMLLFIAVSLLF